jgi:hypothetical protein
MKTADKKRILTSPYCEGEIKIKLLYHFQTMKFKTERGGFDENGDLEIAVRKRLDFQEYSGFYFKAQLNCVEVWTPCGSDFLMSKIPYRDVKIIYSRTKQEITQTKISESQEQLAA